VPVMFADGHMVPRSAKRVSIAVGAIAVTDLAWFGVPEPGDPLSRPNGHALSRRSPTGRVGCERLFGGD